MFDCVSVFISPTPLSKKTEFTDGIFIANLFYPGRIKREID
jgi:hypothetical protein